MDEETGEPQRVEEDVEFGRYTLRKRLAAGGMGIVYVAEDRKLKRTVALKMIRGSTFADEDEVARFTIEAEAAAALDHPNIVPIFEVGRLDGQPFFTMKLIEGTTLARRMKDHGGCLPPREVATLLSKIARAVHHAHQRGVLHRDLKPGNILLDGEGNPWLTDFGLAKVVSSDTSLTLTKDHIGTPHYMAPEVAGGNARAVSTASDVWALGVMLWEMLCGVPPFHGPGPVDIMRRIVDSEPSWPAGSRADGDLVTIARRCMEKTPGRRPQGAGEVADELDRWLRGEPIKARPVTRRERFIKWIRREPAMAALYAVLTVALFAGLFLWNRAERAVVSLSETNERMEKSLRIATATKLAGDARLQAEENPSRALMLAVESVEMGERDGLLPESASALIDVLQRNGGLDATAGGLKSEYNEGWISNSRQLREAAQASPDSRWLMTLDFLPWGSDAVPAAVYDLHERDTSAPLRVWQMPLRNAGADSDPLVWRWMDDSRRIIAVGLDGSVHVMEVISPAMLAGQPETSAPDNVSRGLIPHDQNMAMVHLTVHAAGRGEVPTAVCTWRQAARKFDPQKQKQNPQPVYKVSFCRYELTPEGVKPGPPGMLDDLSAGGARAAFLPGTNRAVLSMFEDKVPARLVNLDAPGDPHYLLPCRLRAWDGFTSDDGSRFALRDWDGSVFVYDIPSPGGAGGELKGREIFPGPGTHETMRFSPDARWLAVSNDNGPPALLDLEQEVPPVFLPLSARSIGMAFSPGGHWLAVGSVQRTVQLWRIDDARRMLEPIILRGIPTSVIGVSFSPDGRNVIASGHGGTVRRWGFDGVSGSAQPVHYEAGSGIVQDLAISPDEKWIASAARGLGAPDESSTGGVVTISKVNGTDRIVLGSHAHRACGVAFSKNGKWVVSTGHDDSVKVWNFPAVVQHIEDGGSGPVEPKFTFPLNVRKTHRHSVTFHPGDGCLYQVNGDGILFAWDLSMADPHAGHQEQDIHSKRYLLPDAAVSPDGKWLAVGRHAWDGHETQNVQHGNQVLLFEVSQYSWPPKFVTALKAGFLQETNLTFSADSCWLAAGANGTGPHIWDLRAADIAASRLCAPTSSQTTMAAGFSDDGKFLAYGGLDGMLHLWNWREPADLRSINTGASITTLAWFRDGRLATAGASNQIAVWDTSIPRLKALARRVAGRELSEAERDRFRTRIR